MTSIKYAVSIPAFVAMRQILANLPSDKNFLLREEVRELKAYIEDVFADQNDINEDTRMQLELISNHGKAANLHELFLEKRQIYIIFVLEKWQTLILLFQIIK